MTTELSQSRVDATTAASSTLDPIDGGHAHPAGREIIFLDGQL
jgi:hypothetical protein